MKIFSLVSICIIFQMFFLSCTIRVGGNDKKQSSNGSIVSESNSASDGEILSYIGPGDMLKIQVYGEKELTGTYQVSPEGSIMFPFIGEVKVEGLNNFSLAAKISEMLKDGYINDPQVTVLVEEFVSKRIFVLGQVKKAGSFPIRTRMSVIEAISLSGGFTDFADISNVVVTRKGKDEKEKRFVIDIKEIVNGTKENFYLNAGDIIFVRERFF
ncbi:MAG TPA: polysaccharide biosynthesis/export family protein [bacterium]|nr:polysaccharide biosynthesis/export family protein [bacterium]HQB08520.1 polysaccharide biosynthesis/export family protein [bacterium]HQM83622.1 polysaccharide biosynthesis/export family protein [bacterium]